MRGSDTDAERRAFLDEVHREAFGRGLEHLSRETVATITQTMADAAVLSDEDVRAHSERLERLAAAGSVGVIADGGDAFEVEEGVAAMRLLRRVLDRELRLRGLSATVPAGPPVQPGAWRVIDGTVRGRALAAAWRD